MGIRNAQIVRTLTRQGVFNSKRGSITSFNSIENTVLMELALSSADYPLDAEAKKKKLMPRTYMYGWRELSKSLGMTIADSLENLSVISNEPRDLRKEETARIRIGRVMKKLQDKGLVKCLKTGRYSKRSSAVWLLTIGDEDENRECEKYVRYVLNLDNKPPDAQPQPNNSMPKHTAHTVTPTTPLQEETEEEMYSKQVCEEIEKFKREHGGLTPFQYRLKYGHNAPDIPTKPQEEEHDAWNSKN